MQRGKPLLALRSSLIAHRFSAVAVGTLAEGLRRRQEGFGAAVPFWNDVVRMVSPPPTLRKVAETKEFWNHSL